MPRAYRKLDPKRWVVGASGASILLIATVIVLVRTGVRTADRHFEREEAIDRSAVRIEPGEMRVETFDAGTPEGYLLMVQPYDAPCRVAFCRVGDVHSDPSPEAVRKRLREEAVVAVKGKFKVVEGSTERGRYAWAVWHDEPKPVRIYIRYQDTRR